MRKLFVFLITVLLTVCFSVGMALAAEQSQEEQPYQLTLTEAIDRAQAYSKVLKQAELDIERADKAHEEAEDAVGLVTPSGMGPYPPQVEAAYTNALVKYMEKRMSKRSLTAAEDTVMLDACNKYWAIQRDQEALKEKEILLNKAKMDLSKARISHQIGLISNQELLAAESAVKAAEGSLAEAGNNLNNAYLALNQLLLFTPDKRPELVDRVEFAPLEVNHLDIEIRKIINNSPTVWQAEQLVSIKKQVRYFSESWAIGDIDMEKAEIDAKNLKDYIELVCNNMYYQIKSMEETYATLQKTIELNEESLRKANLLFQVGMATKSDVVAAEAELISNKKALYDLVTNHEYMKLAFAKPWAAQMPETK